MRIDRAVARIDRVQRRDERSAGVEDACGVPAAPPPFSAHPRALRHQHFAAQVVDLHPAAEHAQAAIAVGIDLEQEFAAEVDHLRTRPRPRRTARAAPTPAPTGCPAPAARDGGRCAFPPGARASPRRSRLRRCRRRAGASPRSRRFPGCRPSASVASHRRLRPSMRTSPCCDHHLPWPPASHCRRCWYQARTPIAHSASIAAAARATRQRRRRGAHDAVCAPRE